MWTVLRKVSQGIGQRIGWYLWSDMAAASLMRGVLPAYLCSQERKSPLKHHEIAHILTTVKFSQEDALFMSTLLWRSIEVFNTDTHCKCATAKKRCPIMNVACYSSKALQGGLGS